MVFSLRHNVLGITAIAIWILSGALQSADAKVLAPGGIVTVPSASLAQTILISTERPFTIDMGALGLLQGTVVDRVARLDSTDTLIFETRISLATTAAIEFGSVDRAARTGFEGFSTDVTNDPTGGAAFPAQLASRSLIPGSEIVWTFDPLGHVNIGEVREPITAPPISKFFDISTNALAYATVGTMRVGAVRFGSDETFYSGIFPVYAPIVYAPVPEPSALALLLAGLLGLGWVARRRRA